MKYEFTPCGYSECAPCNMPKYEKKSMAFVTRFMDRVTCGLLEKGCFIDVGAHAGLWSLHISRELRLRYIKPQIYAFEPLDINYRALMRNAKQGSTGIIPIRAAAWNKTGPLILVREAHPARTWCHEKLGVYTDKDTPRVDALAIDEVAPEGHNKCWGIKIDVEGAELQVLNGARQLLLDNDIMCAVTEYNVAHFERFGHTHREVTKFMLHHGFKFATKADEEHAAKPPTTKSIVNIHWTKGV